MKNKITRFVLLFQGRTGSTFIMDSLDSHPNCISKGEILFQKDAKKQEKIIRKLYTFCQPDVQAVGFKTKACDIADTTKFLSLLDEFHVKVICMYRRNLIKLALSRLNGMRLFQERGIWNLSKGAPPLPPFSPTIAEFEEALEFRKQKEQELKFFMEKVQRPVLIRYYEDLLEDRNQLLCDYFNYINIMPEKVYSNVVKNTDDNMRNVLLNYDEIKAHYKDTKYAAMFD